MGIEVTPAQAKEILALNIRANIVTFLKGSPGTAKSAIAKQLAEEFNLKLIDVRLAQCDPPDLLGFPQICEKTSKAHYVPMSTFPLEGDEPPVNPKTNQKYDGWLLFLDELNAADRAVQKASYRLLLDREVGDYKLHKRVAIIAAGNLMSDAALVEELSSALKSRVAHCTVRPDMQAWLDWAHSNNIDFRITSFIRFSPDMLYTFDPNTLEAADTYACYRTWEFADRQLKLLPDPEKNPLAKAILGGTLSEGVAIAFLGYLRNFSTLPTIDQIIRNPTGIPVPEEPGVQYALSGSLAQHTTVNNLQAVMTYLCRLPAEFQVITLRDMIRRQPEIVQEIPIQEWVRANNAELV